MSNVTRSAASARTMWLCVGAARSKNCKIY